MNRLWLALQTFWKILTEDDVAARAEPLLSVTGAPAAETTSQGPDLRILAVLQRDGRLIDFLLEEMDPYTDAQIGAAARDIHRGCRKALREYLTVEPVLPGEEEMRVMIPADFDPAQVRLTGNVAGKPPFEGILKHHGWRVKSGQLPTIPGAASDTTILAPAEVEIP